MLGHWITPAEQREAVQDKQTQWGLVRELAGHETLASRQDLSLEQRMCLLEYSDPHGIYRQALLREKVLYIKKQYMYIIIYINI